jgi:uncharacterized coiled-coil protein SlyX
VLLEGVQARLDLAERQVAARDALLAELKGALAERDSAIRRQAAHVGQLEQHIRWAQAALQGAACTRLAARSRQGCSAHPGGCESAGGCARRGMGDAQQQLQQQLAALEARCAEGEGALAAAEARAADRQRAYNLLHSDLQVRLELAAVPVRAGHVYIRGSSLEPSRVMSR